MLYNLKNAFELEKFRDKVVELQNKGTMVEMKEKRSRPLSQNAYLHTMLSYFALQFGYSLEETKVHFYKLVVNKDIFARTGTDKFTGELYTYLRSSSELSKDEMSESIERFRSWMKEESGLNFPSSEEYIALLHIQHDIENRSKEYLSR